MSSKAIAERALEQGNGIARLTPTWVPRVFCVPGRRIKLHPDDYYALGGNRGGIDERWFSSTTPADNGPLTSKNEGLSHIVVEDNGKAETVLLRDAVSELKGQLIGDKLWDAHQRWPMYSKFFDNQAALPLHIHHDDEHAARVNTLGKPEAYYFPPQANNHGGDFPYTFFGLTPGVTKGQVKEALENFTKGDNCISDLSAAYQLRPGTGWNVPPGVLHAPGSLCTYEPQKASDVFAMYESLTGDLVIPEELLWKDTPESEKGNFDYLIDVIDWEQNVDPEFKAKHFMAPIPVEDMAQMQAQGYEERWICYLSPDFSAKELTVLPGSTATIKDGGAYGLIVMQGHGKMGIWDIETPALIRFGQLTNDEFFVSESAAKEGVTITNPSDTDPIVILKHFGPDAHDNMPDGSIS
ncbi:MAG: hypothetical protein QGH15_09780 [Kiritimatiellia bacterium]|nr:hypothetical protein [Kiritimatiellia bacterium]